MSFDQRLQTVITPLATTRYPPGQGSDEAAVLVAAHAPHLLQRFAMLAGALQARPLPGGQGVVLACRNGHHGYRTVEYHSHGLHIVLDASEHEASLRWEANGEVGVRLLLWDTTDADLDIVLLNAVAAFVRPWNTGVAAD